MRTERMKPIRGTDIRTFPFFVKLHMEVSRASSIFLRVSFALSRLFEKVSKTSWRLLGSGCEKFGASILSGTLPQQRCPARTQCAGPTGPAKRISGGVSRRVCLPEFDPRLAWSFVLPDQFQSRWNLQVSWLLLLSLSLDETSSLPARSIRPSTSRFRPSALR